MRSEPLVSIGLVTWNSAPHLPHCLAALLQNAQMPFELIVVDNASFDDSLACVYHYFPAASVIRNAANRGFCQAHNQAIRLARGAYYLALNPDVRLQPDYVATLVNELERRSECGMAGGKLQLETEEKRTACIDSTGLFLDRRRRQYLRGHGEVDQGQYDQAGEVFGIDGAASLYRRAMLEDAREADHYFDESFFAYKEDVDLAWRARWLGWSAWYEPTAVAKHLRSFRPGTRGRGDDQSRRYSVRNRYLLLLKNETATGWRRDGLSIALYDLGILAYLLLRERSSLRAFGDVRRLWPEMRRKHHWLMQRARVLPPQLLKWFH